MSGEAVTPPPFIEIEGPPRERGRQYGAKADTRIKRGIENYKQLMEARGLAWSDVLVSSSGLMEFIAEKCPAQHEELIAIATGAGVDVRELLVINGRSEILNAGKAKLKAAAGELDDGCTSAVVMPSRASNNCLLHGQNWDWRPECEETAVVLAVRRDDGPDLLTYVEAGGLARAGLNEIGFAITGNNLSTGHEQWGRRGIPLSIIRRLALEADSFSGALNAVSQSPRSIANNMTVSYAASDGEAFNFETTPDDIYWEPPTDGLIVHANHFTTAAARARVHDQGVLDGMDTLYRDRRVRKLLDKCGDEIGMTEMNAAFRDLFGAPRAVLRAPEARSMASISCTVATILMEPANREMRVCQAPYRSTEFITYRL